MPSSLAATTSARALINSRSCQRRDPLRSRTLGLDQISTSDNARRADGGWHVQPDQEYDRSGDDNTPREYLLLLLSARSSASSYPAEEALEAPSRMETHRRVETSRSQNSLSTMTDLTRKTLYLRQHESV